MIESLQRRRAEGRDGWPWEHAAQQMPGQMPDGGAWPRISIVVPSFNQGRFLEETLRSILLQGYPDLEVIVMDGGSDDDSREIIEHYAPELTYWVSEKDEGQSAAINAGFRHATGELFGWLNSDDYYLPGALHRLAMLRAENPAALGWVGAVQEVDIAGAPLRVVTPRVGTRDAMGRWFHEAGFHQPGCLVDAETFRELGGVNPLLEIFLDVDLWLRVREHGEFVRTDELVATARIYPEAKSHCDIRRIMIEWMASTFKLGMYKTARWRMDSYIDEMQKEVLDGLGPADVLCRRSHDQVMSWFSTPDVLRHLAWRMRMAVGRRLGRLKR